MQAITLSARYDGQHIQLDEPYLLEPGIALMVVVLPRPLPDQDNWLQFGRQNLAAAYGSDEPEYGVADLLEVNPAYDGG